MTRKRKSSLIPRYSFPYTTRSVVREERSEDNPFSNKTESYSFVRGAVEACTIQSLNSWQMNNLPEGIKTSQVFKLFTNTNIFTAIEGTARLSDSIYLPDVYFTLNDSTAPTGIGGWFNVVQVSYYNSGIINHIEAIIAKDDYEDNKDGLSQFPGVVTLNSNITERSVLLDSTNWLTGWEYFNEYDIGTVIETEDDYLYNDAGYVINTLILGDGSTFDEETYPELYEALGTNVLEDYTGEGTYKYVADAT